MRDGESAGGVIAELIGIVLVVATRGDEEDALSEKLDERVEDPGRVTRVVEGAYARPEESETVVDLAKQEDCQPPKSSSKAERTCPRHLLP